MGTQKQNCQLFLEPHHGVGGSATGHFPTIGLHIRAVSQLFSSGQFVRHHVIVCGGSQRGVPASGIVHSGGIKLLSLVVDPRNQVDEFSDTIHREIAGSGYGEYPYLVGADAVDLPVYHFLLPSF